MAYKLLETEIKESYLLYRLDGEAAERHGAIGYMRADFGGSGREFWSTWFDSQSHLKTPGFKREFDEIIDSLRDDGPQPPFADRANLEAFCMTNPAASGYTIRTLDYSYYFRFRPMRAHYDIYCYAYDNRYLLPELAGKHELPQKCFSILPSTGERILIWGVRRGYDRFDTGVTDRAALRAEVDKDNARWGVTRTQEAAMLTGCLRGWDSPEAKPWRYDQNGNLRSSPLPKHEPAR